MKTLTQTSVKQRRVKVATSYSASGYGRGTQTRNVYLIDERYYSYHPEYASQSFRPLKEEFKGYVAVNYQMFDGKKQFYQVNGMDNEHRTEAEMLAPQSVEQPKSAQGELEVIEVTEAMRKADGYRQSDALLIRQKGIDHMNLATIHPWGNPKQFAERIVRAVNLLTKIEDYISTVKEREIVPVYCGFLQKMMGEEESKSKLLPPSNLSFEE